MTQTNVEIDLQIGLPPSKEPWTRNVLFEQGLHARISDLIDDFGLPLVPRVNTRVNKKVDDQIVVRISRKVCRTQIWPPCVGYRELDELELDELIDIIVRIVYQNRELLLTETLLDEIKRDHPKPAVEFLPKAIRNGCSLSILKKIGKKLDSGKSSEFQLYQVALGIARHFPRYLTLEAGPRIYEQLADNGGRYRHQVEVMRDRMFDELGVEYPDVHITRNAAIADDGLRIQIGRIRVPVKKVSSAEDALQTLSEMLIDAAANFLSVLKVQRVLSKFSESFPLPVVNLLERFPLTYITDVLRALVRERVSIRDLPSVIEAMLEVKPTPVDIAPNLIAIVPAVALLALPVAPMIAEEQSSSSDSTNRPSYLSANDCADYVRVAMRRQITHSLIQGGHLKVLETTFETEDNVRKLFSEHASCGRLVQIFAESIRSESFPKNIAILTSSEIRRRLREAISIEFPTIPVICRDEIDTNVICLERGSAEETAAEYIVKKVSQI